MFRANPSFTSRHDTEFTSVDVEIAWIDSHEDVMDFEERWLAHVLAVVKDVHGEQIERTFGARADGAHAAVPAGEPGGGQGDAARPPATPCPARGTTSTRPASGRCRR